MPIIKDEHGRRTFKIPDPPNLGEPTGRERVFESKTGKVVVTEHKYGWAIVAGSKIWWASDGETPWGKFTAEILECERCDVLQPGRPFDGPRGKPVCLCNRDLTDDRGRRTRHAETHCHELGHPERVKRLAESILKTY